MSKYLEWKKRAIIMSANVFWLPSGISHENVLAAYQFKSVGSESEALEDLSGNKRHLVAEASKYNNYDWGYPGEKPTWSTSKGFYLKGGQGGCGTLNNSALNKQDIKSAVVCYSGLKNQSGSDGLMGQLITAGGADGNAQLFASTYFYKDTYQESGYWHGEWYNFAQPGYCLLYKPNVWGEQGYGRIYVANDAYQESGVLGANFSEVKQLYKNGTRITDYRPDPRVYQNDYIMGYTDFSGTEVAGYAGKKTFGAVFPAKSGLPAFASKYLIAAVFFNVPLTAEQHKECADGMLAL